MMIASEEASRRRVVVTGLGAVTPLGNSWSETWDNLLQGRSGATDLTTALRQQHLLKNTTSDIDTCDDDHVDWKALQKDLDIAQQLSCQVAAPVRNIPMDAKTPRFVQFALLAAQEALEQSQLLTLLQQQDEEDSISSPLRLASGVSIGSGMSSVRQIVNASRLQSLRKLSPHFVPSVLQNSASARVSMAHHLCGPNISASTACAASSHAIGDAFLYIQAGLANVMLAGGTEASMDPLSLAGFGRLRALSTQTNNTPSRASRPFSKHRDGFVMAEGAAVLVLEELQHALARGAPILAELTGYGVAADAHHITAPDPNGRGALRAMQMALRMAQVNSKRDDDMDDKDITRVGYVNAHATSTPVGDDIEARVLCDVFGSDDDDTATMPWVSSTKGATGHLLGAAGAVEAAVTIQALVNQTLPATLNLEQDDNVDADASTAGGSSEYIDRLRHVRTTQSHGFSIAMSNSFGFGGTNASLVFRKWDGSW